MTISIPYSFVPGTKAKAQEVNANFISLAQQLDETNTNKLNINLSNLTQDGKDNLKEIIATRNLGETITSISPLTDSHLHLLDGALLDASGIYQEFVEYMGSLYEQNPSAGYFCTENEWQASAEEYGECIKFVYDETDETVRLPLKNSSKRVLIKTYNENGRWYNIYSDGWCEQGGFQSAPSADTTYTITLLKPYVDTSYFIYRGPEELRTNVGIQYIFGIKNGTKTKEGFQILSSNTNYYNGFWWKTEGYIDISDYQGNCENEYIVVATNAKLDIQVDIDQVTTDLNNKMEKDLGNMSASQSAKNEIMHWGIPDYANKINIISSLPYIAPSAGCIFCHTAYGNSYGYNLTVNNILCGFSYGGTNIATQSSSCVFVEKNDLVNITGKIGAAYFAPLKGVN